MGTGQNQFAILAPVPEEHLVSGLEKAKIAEYVAYGTMKWDLFQKIDDLRDGAPVAMLIYPSSEDLPGIDTFVVSWFGWYVGFVHSNHGAHPQGKAHRPASRFNHPADNSGHWAIFWHLEGLRRVPPNQQIKIGQIAGYKGGWRKNAPPRGPELVTLPAAFEGETYISAKEAN